MGGKLPTSTEGPRGPLYTWKREPTIPAVLCKPAVLRTGSWADADFHPSRSRPVNREGLWLGGAGLGPAFPTAKPPQCVSPDAPLKPSVYTSESITMGACAQPVPTIFPLASHRDAELHSSLSGHGARRIPRGRAKGELRAHPFSVCRNQVFCWDTMLHRLNGD